MQHADQTITLYNRMLDAETGYDIYKRTVLAGVSWFGRTQTTVSSDGGLLAADEYTVRIPSEIASGYVAPKAYAGNTGTWTLAPDDIIVLGAAPEESPTRKVLFEAYDNIMTVLSVTDNRNGRGGHIKVVGK